jgi:NAD(P)-dependent dehydrogenase (short-subunit alcohol dehydrogenase family)
MAERCGVVTGSTSGIGLEVARALLVRGWRVLGVARRPAALADPGYTHAAVDLGEPAAVEALCAGPLAAALSAPGLARLGLVNAAAALGPVGPISRLDAPALARAFCVNAVAPMRLAGAVVAAAAGRPVRIVDVSSGAATRPYAGWGAYCATKAALRLAGQVLAEERTAFAPEGAAADLAVASYEPGVVDTAMQAEVRASPRRDFPALERFLDLHARGALVPPARPAAEIADLLAQDAPGFTALRLGQAR